MTIEANNALPGIWRFPPHERQTMWTSKSARFFVMGPEMYCRVGLSDSGDTFDCLELAERSAHAKLDADTSGHVGLSWRIMWGSTQCRWVFDGQLHSRTEISGRLGSACPFFGHEEVRWKPEPLTITKIVLSEKVPDRGGQSAFLRSLLEEMAAGQVTEPHAVPSFISSNPDVIPLPTEAQQKLYVLMTPDNLRPLGNVTAVVYVGDYYPIVGWWGRLRNALGQAHEPNSPVYGDRKPVYAVEFENGERLCTLHRRADGVLDQFQCI